MLMARLEALQVLLYSLKTYHLCDTVGASRPSGTTSTASFFPEDVQMCNIDSHFSYKVCVTISDPAN